MVCTYYVQQISLYLLRLRGLEILRNARLNQPVRVDPQSQSVNKSNVAFHSTVRAMQVL